MVIWLTDAGKIRSAGTLWRTPQKAVIATYICFLINFTEQQLTNIQANITGGAKCMWYI